MPMLSRAVKKRPCWIRSIRQKKTCLVDHLIKAGIGHLDYIVSHHAEQDHSGSIPDMLMMFPDAKVVTNPKCKGMLMDHLHLEEAQFIEVQDGETLSLGDKTLQFIYTPWVHWPETMSTWLAEDKILFSCDFFGSHQACSNLLSRMRPVFSRPPSVTTVKS